MSEDRNGLAVQERAEITPMSLIQSAIMQGASIDTIERLTKLQREMIDYQAKVEFNEALHRCQQKMRPIGADATNPQTKSKYASYKKLDSALRPIYTDEGFSLSFNTVDSPINEHVRVVCDVSCGGHTKTYQIDMPADGKGAKGGDVMTKTHAMGAGVAYGMRYLLKMIFNVAVGEEDNDGNGAVLMPEPEFLEHLEFIKSAATEHELIEVFGQAWKHGNKLADVVALAEFKKARDERKQAIR